MSAVRELTEILIQSGMDSVDAAILIARVGIELASKSSGQTSGARRQAAYRDRNKASRDVTNNAKDKASQTVTNRNEPSQSDAIDDIALSSLVKEKEEIKMKKETKSRGHKLPPDWRPSVSHYAKGAEYGMSRAAVDARADDMRSWALANSNRAVTTKANWDAAFTGAWLKDTRNGNRNHGNRADTAAGRATAREADMVARMGNAAMRYLKNGASAGPGRSLPEHPGATEGHAAEPDSAQLDFEARVGP